MKCLNSAQLFVPRLEYSAKKETLSSGARARLHYGELSRMCRSYPWPRYTLNRPM